jgi:glycosyltransferase involved in cell wall biosynthesis
MGIMGSSKVSLIVPVYKAEPWIDECMASIRAQTYKDVELIVIDDQEGTGAAAARNRGLDGATGEYVMFCDADDYLEPDAIKNLVAAIEGVDMVVGSFRKFGTFSSTVEHETAKLSKHQVAEYVMGNLLSPRSNQMFSGCWAKLYRRDRIGKFPNLTTAEDMAFNFNYLRGCDSVRFLSDIVYNNRKRPGSLSTTFDVNNKPGLFGFLGGLKYVRSFLYGRYGEAEIEKAIDNSKVYHSLLYFTRICDQTGWTMREALMRIYP